MAVRRVGHRPQATAPILDSTVTSLIAAQRFGRFRGLSGSHSDIANRSFMTHSRPRQPELAATRNGLSVADMVAQSSKREVTWNAARPYRFLEALRFHGRSPHSPSRAAHTTCRHASHRPCCAAKRSPAHRQFLARIGYIDGRNITYESRLNSNP